MAAAIKIDAKAVARFSREVRRAAPEAWKACRVRLVAIGEVVAQDARQRAPSPRIVIKSSSTALGNVRISVEGLPGVPQENKGLGHVSHPVFAKKGSPRYTDRSKWTNLNSPPARLLPAFAEKREWALGEMERVYWDTFNRVWSGR